MNLNINRELPSPPHLNQPYLLSSLNSEENCLLVYSPLPPSQKVEEPNKKKFTFKPKEIVNTSEPVHIFDSLQVSWTTKETKGKFPSRREHAAHACLGDCLLIYGGINVSNSKSLNDLYALNLNTWLWKKLFTMEAPPVNANPITVILNDQLVLIQEEVWVFQTKGVNWSAESTDLPGGVW